jgi:uncharacterized repeat protein (TIGR01451 family)
MVHTKYLRELLLVGAYLLGFLGIVASGGGGGGGGSESPTLNYVGNTDQATISETNATKLAANTLGLQSFVDSTTSPKEGTSASVNASHNIALATFSGYLSRKARRAIMSTANFVSRSSEIHARTNVDETEFCDSGSIRITGVIEDNGTGELTLDYRNCREGNETIDGVVNAKVNAFDFAFLLPTDLVLSFSILTLTTPDFSVSIGGSIHSQININTNSEVLTIPEIVARNNQTGDMAMVRNQVSTIFYDNIFFPSSFSETFAGRIYDSVFGYVDFFTDPLFYYSSSGQIYPYDGQLILTGVVNAMIRVIALSDTQVSIDLDLDGDGSFEVDATLNWTEISSPQNLADSDGDGMHDSWEQENGLDANDPDDASLDTDTDGFDNLSEYLGGSDPNDSSSAPPSADLSITKTAPANPVAGTNLTYSISITNLGTIPANDIEVSDTLPAEVSFVSFFAAGTWICVENSGTVTCNRNSLSPGLTTGFDIIVTLPPTVGSISNTATVASSSTDSVQSNNTDTLATNILPATADLEITKTASTSTIGAGDSFTYNLSVRNNSQYAAADVVVSDNLPAGFVLISATTNQGSCTQTVNVTCDLGTMTPYSMRSIDLVVTPTTEGIFDNIANVASSTQDPVSGNNSSTIAVTVGTSTSVIQSQIEAATDGDTITVAPGTYVGNIDFIGKAVTVVSDQGPLVTIIDGGGSSSAVVNFSNSEGPGSVLNGFTIQNGANGGVTVNQASPAILNNIIQNNLKPGSGVGIELHFSSATVSGNIIRGNNRGPGSGGGGGGIYIGGNSSAQIIDNFVLDNLWGAAIELNAAGTPLIQGNTINGNVGGAIEMYNRTDALIVQNVIANTTNSTQPFCGGIYWLVPSGATGPRIINNTIVDNDGSQGSAICPDGYDVQAEIINNTIAAKSGQIAIFCGDMNDLNPPVIESNNVIAPAGTLYGGICIDQTGTNGNISADPLFVDPTNEDYQLGATSPSIDAGDNAVPDIPPTDFLGNNRIIDGDQNGSAIVDMGAYEYNP